MLKGINTDHTVKLAIGKGQGSTVTQDIWMMKRNSGLITFRRTSRKWRRIIRIHQVEAHIDATGFRQVLTEKGSSTTHFENPLTRWKIKSQATPDLIDQIIMVTMDPPEWGGDHLRVVEIKIANFL
jgi:hypothetical protein